MKILILSHKFYPDIGGIEVNTEILASKFHEAGHEIRLMTWSEDSGNKFYPFTIIRNPSLGKLLREHKWAEVVFENNPSLRLSWPCLFIKKPYVVALRTWINRNDGSSGWQDKLKFLWLKRASAVIAVSNAISKRCWPSSIVIGNPYRHHLFRVISSIEKNIGFVFLGRLVSDKGTEIAIKALAKIIKDQQHLNGGKLKFSLTIIGEGPELQSLKNLVRDLQIQEMVTFKGSLKGEELVKTLNMHRIILVPSLWEEPFGNVALEGMACGCVPIVSEGGGLIDAIGNAGLTFERGNVDALQNCMKNLINNPELEIRLRKAAHDHLALHHPDVISNRYLSVLENAV